MLDELKEYEEYTKSGFSETNRVKYSNLRKGDIEGITRILSIIARHFLFHDFAVSADQNQRIICSVEALKSWCGYNYCGECKNCEFPEVKSEIVLINNWMNGYLEHMSNKADDKKKEKIDACVKKLKYKKNQLSQSLFSEKDFAQEAATNSLKKLTYEGIIADALAEGELKKYILLANAYNDGIANCKEVLVQNIYKLSTSKKDGQEIEKISKVELTKRNGDISADADAILKILSWYLKNKKNQAFTYYNGADINNWVINDRFTNFSSFYYSRTELKRDDINSGTAIPLFSSMLIGGNISKVSVCREWIDSLEAKVINEDEWKEAVNEQFKFICIKDMGGGKALEINLPKQG